MRYKTKQIVVVELPSMLKVESEDGWMLEQLFTCPQNVYPGAQESVRALFSRTEDTDDFTVVAAPTIPAVHIIQLEATKRVRILRDDLSRFVSEQTRAGYTVTSIFEVKPPRELSDEPHEPCYDVHLRMEKCDGFPHTADDSPRAPTQEEREEFFKDIPEDDCCTRGTCRDWRQA